MNQPRLALPVQSILDDFNELASGFQEWEREFRYAVLTSSPSSAFPPSDPDTLADRLAAYLGSRCAAIEVTKGGQGVVKYYEW